MSVYQDRLETLFNGKELVTTQEIMEALYVVNGPNRSRDIKNRAIRAGMPVQAIGKKAWVRA